MENVYIILNIFLILTSFPPLLLLLLFGDGVISFPPPPKIQRLFASKKIGKFAAFSNENIWCS